MTTIDTTFQTQAQNEERMAGVRQAYASIREAEAGLYQALAVAFPVGARIKVSVAPRRYSSMTVVAHLDPPSYRMFCQNEKTGTEKWIDMRNGVELIVFAYRAEDVAPALDAGYTVTHSMEIHQELEAASVREREEVKSAVTLTPLGEYLTLRRMRPISFFGVAKRDERIEALVNNAKLRVRSKFADAELKTYDGIPEIPTSYAIHAGSLRISGKELCGLADSEDEAWLMAEAFLFSHALKGQGSCPTP